MSGLDTNVNYKPMLGVEYHLIGDDGSAWTRLHREYVKGIKGLVVVLKDEWRKISQYKDKKTGYWKFTVAGTKTKQVHIHKEVLAAFCGKRPDDLVCRHLDDNKDNNKLSNLCYGTLQDNADDAVRNGVLSKGETHYKHKLTVEQVVEIRQRYANGEMTKPIAKDFGVCDNEILRIATGKAWREFPGVISSTKGRRPRGEQCHGTVLNNEIVRQLREEYAAGNCSYSSLARKYKVGTNTVKHAVTGVSWTEAGGPIAKRKQNATESTCPPEHPKDISRECIQP